ncbi:MAG TPA: peptidylprolyl isomerase [Thermoanaerobaculia bacterium]
MKALLHGVLFLALAACSQTGSGTDTAATDTSSTTTTAASSNETAATDTQPMTSAAPAAQEKPMSAYQNKIAELHTTAGQINLRFFPDVAPNHVKNFLELAEQGFYNGTKFHRIIPGFMIQGGDPNTISGNPATWGTGGSPNNVKAEFNKIPHKRGILSMARSQSPDSASSQFFIVVADSTFLDNNYTVFGEVTQGMDVADKIVSAPKGAQDRPNEPVSITKVVIRDAQTDAEKAPTPAH